jgi:hypothetical protein
MWYRLVLAAALCGIASIAAAQSFDCAKAQTRVEKMVCADRAVADLDEYLGRYYAAARAEIPGAGAAPSNPKAKPYEAIGTLIDDIASNPKSKVFPRAKVFLHRYFCEDFGDKVTYSNVNEKIGFVAVYAGDTAAAAEPILALAKASGYPDANVRRMEVIVIYQIE